MSFKDFIKGKIQTARETFFDDTNVTFTATNLQEAIEAGNTSLGVPIIITSGETFTVATNRQVLMAELTIDASGELLLENGSLLNMVN